MRLGSDSAAHGDSAGAKSAVLRTARAVGRPSGRVHPYRTAAPETPRDAERRAPWDDRILYALGVVIGLIPVVAALHRGGSWGAEPTIGALLSLFAGWSFLKSLLHRS